MTKLTFALNHMAALRLGLPQFFALAKSLGITGVEIRNDIAGKPILDGTPAPQVRRMAADAGVEIISINALQRFNQWTPERKTEALALADYAKACGAQALVLVPLNDGSGRADGERQGNVATALAGLQPILRERGITGLVEPLGFEICSLRSKREAVEAIAAIGGNAEFRVVHDTFHHHLAGEPALFPMMTGLVHISGVDDGRVAVADLRDPHRVLVDGGDTIGNIVQMRALAAGGYRGPYSFEPFAREICDREAPHDGIAASMSFIGTQLLRSAA